MDEVEVTIRFAAQMLGVEVATEPPAPGSPVAIALEIYTRISEGELSVDEGAKQLTSVMMPIWEANGVAQYLSPDLRPD